MKPYNLIKVCKICAAGLVLFAWPFVFAAEHLGNKKSAQKTKERKKKKGELAGHSSEGM